MSSPAPATPTPSLCGVPLKYLALSCLVVQTTSAVILTRYSKVVSDPRIPPYLNTTLVCSAEFTKLTLSLVFMFLLDARHSVEEEEKRQVINKMENGEDGRCVKLSTTEMFWKMADHWKSAIYKENFENPKETLKLAIPAMLYTLQNNLVYVALDNLEATTFQVGYQMKVITTAVLSVLILNRQLSTLKWISLFLLTFGIILTQLDSSSGHADSSERDQSFTLGIASVITCGFSSALAGVYFEKILKGTSPTLWVRNSQLAFFSTILALSATLYFEGIHNGLTNFFRGYHTLVWLIILVQAVGGLIVAVVVKYADNILKGFASAISIILCGILSAMLFEFYPSVMFVFGSMVVIGATFLYAAPDDFLNKSVAVAIEQKDPAANNTLEVAVAEDSGNDKVSPTSNGLGKKLSSSKNELVDNK